jgi:hypothetical protein
LAQDGHGLSGRAHAGKNNSARAFRDGSIRRYGAGNAEMFQGASHACLIARPVIQNSQHLFMLPKGKIGTIFSTSFVLYSIRPCAGKRNERAEKLAGLEKALYGPPVTDYTVRL